MWVRKAAYRSPWEVNLFSFTRMEGEGSWEESFWIGGVQWIFRCICWKYIGILITLVTPWVSLFSTSRRNMKKYYDLKGRRLLSGTVECDTIFFLSNSFIKGIYLEVDFMIIIMINHHLLNLSKNKDYQLVPGHQRNHCKLLLLEITAVVSYWLSNRPSEGW